MIRLFIFLENGRCWLCHQQSDHCPSRYLIMKMPVKVVGSIVGTMSTSVAVRLSIWAPLYLLTIVRVAFIASIHRWELDVSVAMATAPTAIVPARTPGWPTAPLAISFHYDTKLKKQNVHEWGKNMFICHMKRNISMAMIFVTFHLTMFHYCGKSIPVMVKSKHPSAREAAIATMTKKRSRRILKLLFALPILQQLISFIILLGLSLRLSVTQKTQLWEVNVSLLIWPFDHGHLVHSKHRAACLYCNVLT